MTTEITTFDYGQIDAPIAEFLRTKERNMREIVGKAYTELGRELKEAQDELAKTGYGCFQEWVRSMGFSEDKAEKLIHRHKLITENFGERELLEDLPVSLSYAIAAPSAESTEPKRQAKAAVLDGEVKTLKEYREVVAKLEAAEKLADQVTGENEVLRGTVEALASTPPKVEIQTEYAPDPMMSARLKRYESQFGDIDGVVTERISNHTEVDGAAAQFADDIQTLLMDYAHLTTFKSSFMGVSDGAYDEYKTSLDALKEFVNGMQRVMDGTPKGKAEVIDITEYRAN
jgi:hypothetical protein